jgi:flagellar biogenesis protein FliO
MAALGALLLTALNVTAETADAAHAPALSAGLPDAGASLFRVFGAFALVVALFLGGVWLYRNWQKVCVKKNGGAKLNLIEVKSLGQRQAIYVVGYQEQRLLLAASPAGITLLTHLPPAEETEEEETPARAINFAEALQHVLSRRQ